MFGIGLPEMIVILALALIVVGPEKLPDMARSIAKGLLELKKTAASLKEELSDQDNPLKEIVPELESLKDKIVDYDPEKLPQENMKHNPWADGSEGVNPPGTTKYEEIIETELVSATAKAEAETDDPAPQSEIQAESIDGKEDATDIQAKGKREEN